MSLSSNIPTSVVKLPRRAIVLKESKDLGSQRRVKARRLKETEERTLVLKTHEAKSEQTLRLFLFFFGLSHVKVSFLLTHS